MFLYTTCVLAYIYIYYRSLSVHFHPDISAPSALPGPASHSRYLRNATDEDDGERGSSRGLISSLYIIRSADLSINEPLYFLCLFVKTCPADISWHWKLKENKTLLNVLLSCRIFRKQKKETLASRHRKQKEAKSTSGTKDHLLVLNFHHSTLAGFFFGLTRDNKTPEGLSSVYYSSPFEF